MLLGSVKGCFCPKKFSEILSCFTTLPWKMSGLKNTKSKLGNIYENDSILCDLNRTEKQKNIASPPHTTHTVAQCSSKWF